MVECFVVDLFGDLCSSCDKSTLCTIFNAIEDVVCRTYMRFLLSVGNPYVASVYTLFLVFTPSILLDAASLALTIRDFDSSWFEAFIVISGAYMFHTLSKKCEILERPSKQCSKIRYSTYIKLKEYYREKIMKMVLEDIKNVDIVKMLETKNPIITPLTIITTIIITYICNIDQKDPIQHIIDTLRYSINEETLKTISEYNTQTITT